LTCSSSGNLGIQVRGNETNASVLDMKFNCCALFLNCQCGHAVDGRTVRQFLPILSFFRPPMCFSVGTAQLPIDLGVALLGDSIVPVLIPFTNRRVIQGVAGAEIRPQRRDARYASDHFWSCRPVSTTIDTAACEVVRPADGEAIASALHVAQHGIVVVFVGSTRAPLPPIGQERLTVKANKIDNTAI